MSEAPTVPPVSSPPVRRTDWFPALRHPNYRKWFFGAIISVIGTWMTLISLNWVLWDQTKSSTLLGLFAIASQLPTLLLLLPAGVIVDRVDKRRMLFTTQLLLTVASGTLAVLSLMGWLDVNAIFIVAILRGIVFGFDMPVRQSFVLEMVDREALQSAVALNSAIFNTGRVLGPAMAGYLLWKVGPTLCFTVDAASYCAVLIALALMHLAPFRPRRQAKPGKLHELKMGVLTVLGNRTILLTMATLAVGVFIFSYGTLLPVFADNVFGGGAETFGYLSSAGGVGALIGAVCVSAFCRPGQARRWMFGGMALAVFAMAGLALSSGLWAGMAAVAALSFAMLCMWSPANASIQMAVKDRYRGRVMSLMSLVFFGAMPLGAMFYGSTSEAFESLVGEAKSPRLAVGIGAALALTACIALGVRLLRGRTAAENNSRKQQPRTAAADKHR